MTSLAQIEGKYDVLEVLHTGGMGKILRVRHRLLKEVRVIKTMRRQLAEDAHFRQRFLREAQLAANLKHPNIAQIHDFSAGDDGTGFIVMEFIDGVSLKEVLAHRGSPGLEVGLEMARQALRALGFLHRKGYVHRDISPDNIMLATDVDGRLSVKLIDLGIAKKLGVGEGLTTTGHFLGKLRYSSPEHFGELGAAAADERSDVYSFGLVLYEFLTGEKAIRGNDLSSLSAGHLMRPPVPFDDSDPHGWVPEDLRHLVIQSLAKEPQARFSDGEAFAALLSDVQSRFPLPSSFEAFALVQPVREARQRDRDAVAGPSTQMRLDQHFGIETTPGTRFGTDTSSSQATGTEIRLGPETAGSDNDDEDTGVYRTLVSPSETAATADVASSAPPRERTRHIPTLGGLASPAGAAASGISTAASAPPPLEGAATIAALPDLDEAPSERTRRLDLSQFATQAAPPSGPPAAPSFLPSDPGPPPRPDDPPQAFVPPAPPPAPPQGNPPVERPLAEEPPPVMAPTSFAEVNLAQTAFVETTILPAAGPPAAGPPAAGPPAAGPPAAGPSASAPEVAVPHIAPPPPPVSPPSPIAPPVTPPPAAAIPPPIEVANPAPVVPRENSPSFPATQAVSQPSPALWPTWTPNLLTRLPWLQGVGIDRQKLTAMQGTLQTYRWLVAGALASVALVVAIVWVMASGGEAPPPPVVVAPPPVVVAPPPPVVPVPVQTQLHPDLVIARDCLETGDLECAHQSLQLLTDSDIYLTQTELDELADLEAELTLSAEAATESLGDPLAFGETVMATLKSGPIEGLKDAVDALSKIRREDSEALEVLESEMQTAIREGDRIIGVYRQMWGHKRAKRYLETIRSANQLIGMYPPYVSTAKEHRDEAAKAVEQVATAMAENNDPLGAASQLRLLKKDWPERSGLAARISRLEALYQADQAAEEALEGAREALANNQPEAGMAILSGLTLDAESPYIAQVEDLRRQLTERFQQMDQQAPVIQLATSDDLAYRPKEPVRVRLRISDDYAVESVSAYVRFDDTGNFSPVLVQPGNAGNYVFEIGADDHGNPKKIYFYVEARDRSSHVGVLGSPQAPQEIKKLGFLKRLSNN